MPGAIQYEMETDGSLFAMSARRVGIGFIGIEMCRQLTEIIGRWRWRRGGICALQGRCRRHRVNGFGRGRDAEPGRDGNDRRLRCQTRTLWW